MNILISLIFVIENYKKYIGCYFLVVNRKISYKYGIKKILIFDTFINHNFNINHSILYISIFIRCVIVFHYYSYIVGMLKIVYIQNIKKIHKKMSYL